ncbi:sigma-54-dependent Fis family transcriptional regulator [Salimicrobium jeotgali]|uniref:Sigma-54-dependent Fis family transcriptional regulator n=1 Tax=Salimicrobium jeotgali TaxID=1230341 RepID=K2G8M8_9BACI|nr:sigma-54-dependent Fis family transcriptional regulator [Salimicrobium jeotgali]AKG03464.1 sigma-54-dependent Fis family transcriptional regulator [Salimicrobium jeotgali]EKE30697.1 YqiR family transcription regulator [Salimicrobium jeotgali]MBM7697174.1 transcriptional regulator with PAS, ATPase and Fis domain [Salimicrobium jeotgali]
MSLFEKRNKYMFETLFGSTEHCIVVVDKEGVITYINSGYADFIGVDRKKAEGRHVTEVIENTRMHIVVETGREEVADLQYIRGDYMIANRIPVFEDGELTGAFGMVLFRDTDEWKVMNTNVKELLMELESYRENFKKNTGASYSLHNIVSHSPKMMEVKDTVRKMATGDASVLLRGESGTGKELFAHSLHNLSERNGEPFIKVNCAAIPEQLFEAELFGYEEGAFTGAKKGGKAGKFQLADGGTLFLDEVGDMPLHAQVKILRALQEGEVEPLGSETSELVNVRVVAATNQALEELISRQEFREDLYYRINVVSVDIPPLRERPEDIRLLAKYILSKTGDSMRKKVEGFSEATIQVLEGYPWPGNIRELENTIESAVHMADGSYIEVSDLPGSITAASVTEEESLKTILERVEKETIEQALTRTSGDKNAAAAHLGIGKTSLYDKAKKYGI